MAARRAAPSARALCALCARPAAVVLAVVVALSGRASARIADYNVDTLQLDAAASTPPPWLSSSSAQVDETSETTQAAQAAQAAQAGALAPWTVGAARVLRRLYLECRDDDLGPCLKMQLVRALDRVARSTRRVALATGVTLERDADAPEQEASQDATLDDLERTLPRSLPERDRSLDKLILDRLYTFLQNYSLRLKLPSIADLGGPAVGEDARRRRQPFNGMMGLGMVLAGSLLPMKFGMLAMLAGKALMLSKLALLISAIMAMRNMSSGGGSSGGGSAHH